MKLLAITCYTGGVPMADMTHRMVAGLFSSFEEAGLEGMISVCAQGADKELGFTDRGKVAFQQLVMPDNRGFAIGMNLALAAASPYVPFDAVLCLNNDLEFPHVDWLKNLIATVNLETHVGAPTNTYSSSSEQQRPHREDRDPVNSRITPAICWLLSWRSCGILFDQLGFLHLFREDLGRAWGEDVYSAAYLRKGLGTKPFRIVPRAWVKHLGARTSSLIPVAERLAANRKAHQLLKEEFSG